MLRKLFVAVQDLFKMKMGIGGRKRYIIIKLSEFILGKQGEIEVMFFDYKFYIDLGNKVDRVFSLLGKSMYRYFCSLPLSSIIKRVGNENEFKKYFIDVGANTGLFSFIAKTNGFETILFEPEQSHFDFLQKNPEVFNHTYRLALSDFEGEAEFYVTDDKNMGANSLNSNICEQYKSEKVHVDVSTFSQFISKAGFDMNLIKIIKIDVEGSEIQTVKGMSDFLDEGYRPEIFCEVRGDNDKGEILTEFAVTDFFKGYDYNAYVYIDGLKEKYNKEKMVGVEIYDIHYM